MQRSLIWSAVFLVFAGSLAHGQMSTDEAMSRLKQRQAARASLQPTTRPSTDDFSACLNSIVDEANTAISVPTDGLTTAQSEEVERRRETLLSSLAERPRSHVFSCTVLIIDVERGSGSDGLTATAQMDIPVPIEVTSAWQQEILAIKSRYDDQIRGWKNRQGNRDSALFRSQISQVEREKSDAIAVSVRARKVPTATLRIEGGADLIGWRPGQKRRIESIRIDEVRLSQWEWTNERAVSPNGEMKAGQLADSFREAAAKESGQTTLKPVSIPMDFIGSVEVAAHISTQP